ncbi:hypothetical protein B5F40_15150 [Gordonibacter sp. An230]|uniref:PseG/SpsG family protein n=1 Tax=Gordonibacter sp. An230 TaxID=1965592 RepID=UPI000B38CF59|nr:hypothetical protein [Gordonibacter sp. An230]OUO86400.1 hypothetical protein B5F40_15150 [Gordonibacter sp. An230]
MIVFRVDANGSISAGHVMRCLAIAEEASGRGIDCLFVSADEGALPFVSDRGFRCEVLGTDWRDIEFEIPSFAQMLRSLPDPVVVVDTYQANERYMRRLSTCARMGYLGTKIVPGVDFLINYSLNANRSTYDALVAFKGVKLMVGPTYSPLRRAFSQGPIRVSEQVRSILVTTGNTDPIGVTGAIVGTLEPIAREEGVLLKVVVGPMFDQDWEWFERIVGNSSIEICRDVKDMAALMRSVDLAVSACGTTLYELGACGVPTVGFSLSLEQDSGGEAAALGSQGCIEYAGRAYREKSECVANVGKLVKRLIDDRQRRKGLSLAFHTLVDGHGCERICDELQKIRWL